MWRIGIAAALAVGVWIGLSSWVTPTRLEATFHEGCGGVVRYVECLQGGRQNSAASQFVTVERHRSYAGLTPDDVREIEAAGWHYICDQPELCAS